MKNVIKIIKAHGGLEALKQKAIRIDPPSSGYMRLCIEYVGQGPRGQALVSIAHYYEQNGDLCQDPEVVVEVPDGKGWDDGRTWGPISFSQAPTFYQEACFEIDGQLYIRPGALKDIKAFSTLWDKNIGEQGYVEAFEVQKESGYGSR